MIHQTAIVDASAQVDANVSIGPYAIVRENVHIGSGTAVGAHALIEPYVTIGPDCQIFSFAAIGGIPQTFKFEGEKTYVKIGRGTVIREYVTVNRGTAFGGGLTEVGEENMLMAYSHVAHDCRLGRRVVLANGVMLAGHITIGNHATVGGLVGVHQFVRIGDYAFVGGKSAVVKDIPPYTIAAGDRATLHGLNSVGLKRNGFSEAAMAHLKRAYRILFRIGLTRNEALRRVEAEVEQIPEVLGLLDFIKSSQRGITR